MLRVTRLCLKRLKKEDLVAYSIVYFYSSAMNRVMSVSILHFACIPGMSWTFFQGFFFPFM